MVVFFAIGWPLLLRVVAHAGLKKVGWAIWAMILCDIVVGAFFFGPHILSHNMSHNHLPTMAWNFVWSSVPSVVVILWLRPWNVANGTGWLRPLSILAAILIANYILANLIYTNLAVLVYE